jgi:hypothetical protein
MKPTKSILDKSFAYVPSCATDIRERFAAERARLALIKAKLDTAQEQLRKLWQQDIERKVSQIRRINGPR